MLVFNKGARLRRTIATRAYSTSKTGHTHGSTTRPSGPSYLYLGLMLTTVFTAQYAMAWDWPWLSRLQGDDVYKQISGFGLLVFFAHQWQLSISRARGVPHKTTALGRKHKWIGALAPMIFYLHSQQWGYGYQELLSLAFFGIFLTGLCNQEVTRIHKTWFRPTWVTLHVGLSMALLSLLSYHVYIGYAYQ